MNEQGAVVLFSGGQDSRTCLAWALDRYSVVETIGFQYGQSHAVEMTVREKIRKEIVKARPEWAQRLASDQVYDASVIAQIGQSQLTGAGETILRTAGLPNTFVPARNLLFITLAAAHAYRRGLKHIITGVCETDYSGYPDCRDDTMKALQVAINLGTDVRFVVETPLMWIDKAQTWRLAHQLGGDSLVETICRETHTCYKGDRTYLHAWGYGCGECAACELRSTGWSDYICKSREVRLTG